MKNLFIFVLLTCWLTACSGTTTDPEPVAARPSATPPPALATLTPDPNNPSAGSDISATSVRVLTVKREGGFAGITEEWIVYEDGGFADGDNTIYKSDPEAAAKLFDLLDQNNFTDLKKEYTDPNHCCDFFTYTYTLTDANGQHTVTFTEGLPNLPDALYDITDEIQVALFENPQE
ncbi:MAG TPA: protealysin inhibitor emfourin [Anaerolineae bacterium]|nr:protealysin inhibitor emfourin [Anaerolineae bacterium]